MSQGRMDMLTIIPIDEIVEKGAPCVKMAIESFGISNKDRGNGEIFETSS